jgi:bifunctional non-homologous end joining protein LigD
MKFKSHPAGFVIPAQSVKASKPPYGADWVHEIKHDGYRLIVAVMVPRCGCIAVTQLTGPRDCRRSRLLPDESKPRALRLTARRSCSGPTAYHGSRPLSRREAADTTILYAFDLIEDDGDDLRNRPFLDRKAALARLLRNTEAGILFNEHIAEDGPVVFAHACRLGAEGIVSKKTDSTYRSGPSRVWIKVRNPASIAVKRERSEMWNR